MAQPYDLIVIGAGSGGLVAARFAAELGATVVLVEKNRIGGDCTWTGCIPSKALLKAAKAAHTVRTAATYGVVTSPPRVDMPQVHAYLQQAIASVYRHETPEILAQEGIDVVMGAARFLDGRTIQAGEQTLQAKNFLLTTGARPSIPPIKGLDEVSYLTYEQIFENDILPGRLLVVGAGPVGAELAQAYQRLGSQVMLVDDDLLLGHDPDVTAVLGRVFAREGIQFIRGQARTVNREGKEIVLQVNDQNVRGDTLLVATGRVPNVVGLELEKAGVVYSKKGIVVDDKLRTSARHIFAAGDCLGGQQFTHLAAWQAFQAARNALLPGSSSGFTGVMPWTIFTDPEVAHVGLHEAEARQNFGENTRVSRWNMARTDRAVCENDQDGFIKVIHHQNGSLIGATIVAGRAGEVITEFALALHHQLKLKDLAHFIHVYPTYATAVMQLAAETTMADFLGSLTGRVVRKLARIEQ